MLNLNDPIKVVHLQKLSSQSILHDALVIENVKNSFNENKNNYVRLINQESNRQLHVQS